MATHRASSSRQSMISGESSVRMYQDDSDFDEAFKNLLRPIELIAKTNHYDRGDNLSKVIFLLS